VRRVFGVPGGAEALVLTDAARAGQAVLYIARDDVHMDQAAEAIAYVAPDVKVLTFPAWDCLPYDRVSPKTDIVARRVGTLTDLRHAAASGKGAALVVLTTVSAVLQRVPPRSYFDDAGLNLAVGDRTGPEKVLASLAHASYARVETVYEPGEFAVRGGIIDIFPAGAEKPVRLDFFGDELEQVREFDPTTQRSESKLNGFAIRRALEAPLDDDAVSRFRSGYRVAFGAGGDDDPLYESISAGRAHPGMEHWLPLFHDGMERLFEFLTEDTIIVLDPQAGEAAETRLAMIEDYHQARAEMANAPAGAMPGVPYRPLPPDSLYLSADEWREISAGGNVREFSAFDAAGDWPDAVDLGGRPGRDFGDVRARPDADVFQETAAHIKSLLSDGAPVVVDAYSEGARTRLITVLEERGVTLTPASDWQTAVKANGAAAVVLGMPRGFVLPGRVTVITEQDILGERVVRRHRVKVRPENLIASVSDLNEGDLVVHAEHGIGRYDGLQTIDVGGAAHDCLMLVYAGDDKLFIPVENLEIVTRYGAEGGPGQLDRLGGAAWQARKARMKERIRDMAEKLMQVAAERLLKDAPRLEGHPGAYDEFCARFPYDETEDQLRAISETISDLGQGRPTDRLVCGDVGFGKTEVALRAAFTCALEGKQVAVVVPTTLLARQHFRTFEERFAGFPVKVAQLSRLVTAKEIAKVKEGMAKGEIDIVVGTHALLAKDIKFRDLGLLIIDEEQHFGVAHKEQLKRLKTNVHVLVLTATPIPRTLQMALTGLREMSLIATPPVDRLAVRTFVLPFDPVIIREAMVRELHRGGQVYYVCPRISDLDGVANQVMELVPDARVALAHGQMKARDLEDVFQAFADGAYDVLVSTNIIESGLDLPRVNTIIMHRADRFGLSQLYQLRGRVGRSKIRAYAYLTVPARGKLTATAEKRLEVMQTLDTLGAGFTLASHDMDIRGAGNLLGEEQSGHIKEVGVELYQRMLEEAVAEAKSGGEGAAADEDWSPQISLGTEVLIPDHYVADLSLRLELYRRISRLSGDDEMEDLEVELIDRFGPIPESVRNLLDLVRLKGSCRRAGIAKVDAGPRGATVQFRGDDFADPAGLVAWLQSQNGRAKLRPDHKLIYVSDWPDKETRTKGVRYLVTQLAAIAGKAAA
jgi:transcription-repair coupling factor (superfamily II helicase)